MVAVLAKLFRNQDGATAIEYALIASVVSIAAFTVITNIGTNLSAIMESDECRMRQPSHGANDGSGPSGLRGPYDSVYSTESSDD